MSVWDLFKRKKKKPEKVDPAANLNQETEAKPAAEKAELETHEKVEREAREKAERESREKAEREAREKAEREAREKAEREAREKAEREAHEKAEHEAREKAEREAREKAEREAREKAEREAREKAEREAREKAEHEAREKAEHEAREKAEREAREKAEREAREKAEREAREKAERERERRSKSVRRRVRVMRAALVTVFSLLLVGAIIGTGYFAVQRVVDEKSNLVEVPAVIGRMKEDAITMLISAGLEPAVTYDEYPLVKENLVADQSVAPGQKVEKGSFVTITVSRSVYETNIPTVTGVPLSEAQEILTNAGLVVSEIETQPSEAANMIVIQQVPDAGTNAHKGDSVKLIVSGGIVVMPSLQGMTRDQAEQTIIAYGLTLAGVYEEVVSDPAQIGVVTSQAPAMYSEILPGAAVTFTIGKPSQTLYAANVDIDLSAMNDGATLTVDLLDSEGNRVTQYTEKVEQGGGSRTVTLYRETPGEAEYAVSFDGTEVYRGTVTFGENK